MEPVTNEIARETLRNAIFAICGSREPDQKCLDRIARDASHVAKRSRPWSGGWLYILVHLDRYKHYTRNGKSKFRISPELLNAVLQLAKHEAAKGKESVNVYAKGVHEGSIVFGRSKKCARRRCGVYFVSDVKKRLYCSDECERLIRNFRRKDAIRKHQLELARKRAARARRKKKASRRPAR